MSPDVEPAALIRYATLAFFIKAFLLLSPLMESVLSDILPNIDDMLSWMYGQVSVEMI